MKLLLSLLFIINFLNQINGHAHYYYDKFVIKGPGCSTNGELLNLGECTTNICGGIGQLITATDYAHGEFKSTIMGDIKCENTTNSIEFSCGEPDGKSIPIGNYNLVCFEEGTAVAPNYQSYSLSGASCKGDEVIPVRGDCVKVCGAYSEVTRRGRAVATYVLSLYGQDPNCTTATSASEFICSNTTKVSVNGFSVACQVPDSSNSDSSTSSASSLKALLYLSMIILSISILF